jgi:hypothetical protein
MSRHTHETAEDFAKHSHSLIYCMCPKPIFFKQVLLVGYLTEEYDIYNYFLVTVYAGIATAIHIFP